MRRVDATQAVKPPFGLTVIMLKGGPLGWAMLPSAVVLDTIAMTGAFLGSVAARIERTWRWH